MPANNNSSKLRAFDLDHFLKSKQAAVNDALDKIWERWNPCPTRLLDAMRYYVDAGGKRLRPILCIAAAEIVGGTESQVMAAACAIELIHTYSLIHDDLPALDNDDLRRGRPTCHVVFGEPAAILAGDALLTGAFEIMSSIGPVRSQDRDRWLAVIARIAMAAGCKGMVEGQMMDLAAEGQTITTEQLERLQLLKTGALIRVSLESGALLASGNAGQVSALAEYGQCVGLAFQLADDILNVEGSSDLMGKPVGNDEALQKATGPAVMGIDKARLRAEELLNMALEALRPFGRKGAALAALARYVVQRKM